MKPKEYLVKHGHLDKIGRGRLSSKHIEIIENAVANGANIEGYSATAAPVENEPKVVRKVENNNDIVELQPYRYSEDEFVAFEYVDGKKITRSLREACRNCRVSLVQCWCGNPTIVARNGCGDVSVTIVRK